MYASVEAEQGAATERERLRLELLEWAEEIESGRRGPGTAPYAAQNALRDFARRLEPAPIEIPLSNGIAQALAGTAAVRICSCRTGYDDPDCPFHASH